MPTLGEIAKALGGRLDGPADHPVRAMAALDDAGPEDLVFAKDDRNLHRLRTSRAGAVLCREGDDVGGRPAIRVENPRLAAAKAVAILRPVPPVAPGIHPTAVVLEGGTVGEGSAIAPYVVVGRGARVGRRVSLGAHVVVGDGCRVGDDTRIDAHVVLYPGVTVGKRCAIHSGVVIGGAGFGVEMGPDGPVEFPQNGTVILGDEVRIGANCTIDRATFGATRLGDGTKLDNLIQVSHNVVIGKGVVICALSGIGGGAKFGDRAVMGPQGAMSPEAVLGPGTILGARGALASHTVLDAPGRVFMDGPAMPLEDYRRWTVFRFQTGRALRERRERRGRKGRQRGSQPRSKKET
jgi:UDP-3-O-[3-hydroxymyristoyl] glucosamine N-acyltransferase